tara:strand:+ start:1998 stop:4277 length:2280 start_codon:yes stop_codon:yes gene_type:complete
LRKQTTLKIANYLTEIQKEVFEIISEHKNILISSNPASGKTTLFAQLCIDSISNPINNNRIIFCAPYLIIQEQFKQRLLNSKVSVDFELNGLSERKKLNKEDRIITSTFKSFPKISENLNTEDIVIIDEAHTLLVVFSDKKTNKHDHFGNFYKSLYDTKAKIVLMTGTPVESFQYWFDDLHEIKVLKESAKAKVKIQYSDSKENDIVIQFAKECIEKYDKNSLNVIYVKSKIKCEKIAKIIELLGYKGLVLTSETKSSKEYEELVKYSIISLDYQFLITTNVISTGANILNENMGKALMLNEHDPIEIKQFSKRFRNKLDIEIDVVNKYQKNVERFENLRDKIREKRNLNREYLRKIKQNLNVELEPRIIDELEFNQLGGEAYQLNPKFMQSTYLKRNLLQEIYYHQEITKTYNDRNELINALNEFDDIISVEIQAYESSKTDFKFNERAYQENKKAYFNDVIDDFIANPEVYLWVSSKYIKVYHKYSDLTKISSILDKFVLSKSIDEEAKLISINPPIINNIIAPLIEYYSLFDIGDARLTLMSCLKFIKVVPKNKRSKHAIALWFNHIFHESFKIPDDYGPENYNLDRRNSFDINENKNSKLIYFLLNQSFNFLMNNEEIYYQEFKNYIISSDFNVDFFPDKFFPWRSQLTIHDGTITEIDTNFGFGLLHSIFAIKSKQEQKKHPKIKSKGRVNTHLPANMEYLFCLNQKETQLVISSLTLIKTSPPTYLYNSMNLNESERVVIDRNYLTLMASSSI